MAMQIELKDAIVIVDEAHNIEDVARNAGSFEVTQETIQRTHDSYEALLSVIAFSY
jgi:Fanconi anemia group J protein